MFESKPRAPEFQGITAWINTEPLTLEALRGKVVLVDFWTYTCINCIRTIPFLNRMHEKYSKDGLVIIGVHSPEFDFEGDAGNVRRAVERFGIKYPVAVDSGMDTWNAYSNRYWPAKYLLDRDGYIDYMHFGEGDHNQIEDAIQVELGAKKKLEKEEYIAYLFDQSPETYAGIDKNMGLGSGLVCDRSGCNIYIDPGEHDRNTVYPHGQWEQKRQYLELTKAPGQLSYKFNARQMNIVVAPVKGPVAADIFIDGNKSKTIEMAEPAMYTVFQDKDYGEHESTIVFNGLVRAYAYTFG